MLDYILQKDTELLIFLNSLGSERWDDFWLTLTNQYSWTPLFAFLLILLFYRFNWKNALILIVFIAAFVAFSDQFTNFIKGVVGRVRPCNAEGVMDQIRYFSYRPRGLSFYSGHASLSMTFTTFMILLMRKHSKWIYLMLIFPLTFGYSRIYLGVHYPLDVFVGYLMGILWGNLFYYISYRLKLSNRFS